MAAPDLRFTSVNAAIPHCRVADAAISEVLGPIVAAAEAGRLDSTIALWLESAGARAQGLHRAIERETLRDNPHAV